MTTSPATRHSTSRAFLALGAACALVPSLAMWGFTVDDALISVRYAHNLAAGAGYRFDASGPSTDGVTPLPWAFLLAPFAGGDLMTALVRAKVLGVVAWAVGGGALGARVGAMVGRADARAPRIVGARALHVLGAAVLIVMALAFPLGAWAASGMETGLAMMLATLAATRVDRPRQAAALAGVAAALRPEMVVWATVLAVGAITRVDGTSATQGANGGESGADDGGDNSAERGAERTQASRVARGVAVAAMAVVPFLVCAALRWIAFGRPAPLAVLAKPSDLSHGALYAAAASVVLLLPLVVFAPWALVRARGVGTARVLVVAFLAHALAVAVAGGDWMPYARLMVPVAPGLVLAFVDLAAASRPAWSGARLACAAVLGVLVAQRAAPAGRSVHVDRAELIARARPVLADAHVVAALDIGWVSASTDARIVDLAGLTDPSIALLPGGHTSKRVDTSMLIDRGVDTVIVYSELRVVEARIAGSELFASRFEARERLSLGSRGAYYTVYRRR